MKLIEAAGTLIDVDKLVAIKRGSHWSNERQDWRAIAVFSGGAEVELDLYVSDLRALLEHPTST